MKENPLQYRVRGTPVPTTQTRGTNYPKSTVRHRHSALGMVSPVDFENHAGSIISRKEIAA